jgi:hypothetical protein
MEEKLYIVRRSNLVDFFGAAIFKSCCGGLIAATDDLTEPDEKIINDISGRDIFIVGNYYMEFLDKLRNHCRSIEIFLSEGESYPLSEDIKIYLSQKNAGFATYAVQQNSEKLEELEEGSSSFLWKIGEMLEEVVYGFPTEDSLNFYNGITTLSNTLSEMDKLALVTNKAVDIDTVKKRGMDARAFHFPVIQERKKSAKDSRICDKYTVCVCLGKDNVLESCQALSEKHGIGFLMHYDTDRKGTHIHCGVSKTSGLDAREVLKDYIGESVGSMVLSSGFMPGLCELYKLFC